jgi:O-antigen biosynthesis protein
LPGSLSSALETLESAADIGAVGGKLILPDGTLQEAGSIIWRDGSCQGYGRDGDPTAAEFNFVRDVDFCSGAFLLTPAELFRKLGGFDERFAPAYYEDADYCVRLWQRGFRTVYEPRAAAMHFEFASSPSQAAALALQSERRELFARTHAAWLSRQEPPAPERVLSARSRPRGHRLLVVDDRVPHPAIGFGFGRAATLVTTLVELGHHVTLYATNPSHEEWPAIYADIPRGVEVIMARAPRQLTTFLAERHGYYQAAVVSRPHNMRMIRGRAVDAHVNGVVPVVYDAEAITATREIQRRRLLGEAVGEQEESRLVGAEIELARSARTVCAVSEPERRTFITAGIARVERLGHAIEPAPTATPFDRRRGLLFVGAFHEFSPNADSVQWFLEQVRPRLKSHLGEDVPFFVIGPDPPASLARLADPNVHILGSVDRLDSFYSTCRVFVAPTRFAAGIPLKVYHAAAHGLPVVSTMLLAEQLGWRAGEDLMAADSPESFARHCADLYATPSTWETIRAAGLARVKAECSPVVFRQTLDRVIRQAIGEHVES